MVDAWNVAEEMAETAKAEAGVYQKWAADGEAHVGAFCAEPYARKVHWNGVSYEECQGDGCALCKTGNRATLRVALNFYHVAEKRMKIVEGGLRWFGDIMKVRKKYGLGTWAFEITRNGAPRDPKTTYSILPDHKLDEAALRYIAAVDLHDLARDASEAAHEAYAEDIAAAHTTDTGATVPVEVARELHGLLRQCSKAEVDTFLRTFGINRVSQLKAADEAQARKHIESLQDLPF